MMYLSHLLINVGSDPDRPRPGRLWLRNVYRVHQRLAMAFPSASRLEADGDFLQPYAPEDFPEQRHIADQKPGEIDPDALRHVHTPRGADNGFLFRIDPLPSGRAVILVQSALKPNWVYAFGLRPGLVDPRTNRPIGNAGHLLADFPSEPRHVHLTLEPGSRFRFRLVANPVRKVSRNSLDAQGRPVSEKWIGRHVPVPGDAEHLREWLERRAEPRWSAARNSEDKQQPPGFRLIDLSSIQTSYVYFNKNHDGATGQRLRSARYEGVLEVTDCGHFRQTLARGVGPGKAYGFGLLSLARAGGEEKSENH